MIRHQNLKLKGSKKAFIFGPFIGELYWEAYRFAPYAISLKKRFPNHHLLVCTRSRSFDLYGRYASVLTPLMIDDNIFKESKFTLKGYFLNDYKRLCKHIKRQFVNEYNIIDHYAPQIEGFMYKVKWQLPRSYMDYDFKPRMGNEKIINELYGDFDTIVISNRPDVELKDYEVVSTERFSEQKYDIKNTSELGCLIQLIRKSKFVISNFDDNLARFAVLCGTTVITVNEKYTDDAIHLMNPLKINVIRCDTIEEGVKRYEDNI